MCEKVQLHCFACEYPLSPTWFIEDLLTMCLWWSCKNYLIVNGLFYIYVWAFYSVLLVYI